MIIFDILFLNGTSLVQESLRDRKAQLSKVIVEHSRLRLALGSEIATSELGVETVTSKLDEALSAHFLATTAEEKIVSRADGLLLKPLDGAQSQYLAGQRGWQALEKPPISGPVADKMLLEALLDEERKLIPALDEFHFTVISGFRTRTVEGITDILRIQKFYNDAGVVPTWYVDNECPDEYRKLGLTVVKAGKLIPARNKALEDAGKAGKICVQTSDDIGSWTFLNDTIKYPSQEEANAAWKRCEKLQVSPVAAARFICAKMRAFGPGRCRLGGVYPIGNGGRSLRAKLYNDSHFLLGDFFVAEVSPCRFDEKLTLKEDYDFTASHLDTYGQVLRVNRMLITAKHETNAGGACDARDAAGERERYNINVLKEKWPGAIQDHPTRANQIILRWTSYKKRKQASSEQCDNAVDEISKP